MNNLYLAGLPAGASSKAGANIADSSIDYKQKNQFLFKNSLVDIVPIGKQ